MKQCNCGCGQLAPIAKKTDRRAGVNKGEPLQFILGHATRKSERYAVDAITGCWNWLLKIHKRTGYAQEKIDGRTVEAHVTSYERVHGPVPEGHEVHHECKNRRCINPAHLSALSKVEHIRLHWKHLQQVAA